jgi:uncharacterized protein YjeT (DUF2065 family)
MAHTITVLTLQLAQALGLYAIAAGIGIVTAPARFAAIVEDMARVPGLTYAFGVAAFAIGVAILIPHHVLYDPLSVVVTLIAAFAALEGLLLLAAPQVLLAIARPIVANARPWGIASIVLGLILFLCGFTGRADALP